MIKLIASDLDGTLIPEGKKELNPEIYDIILELKKHGIVFVSASGRQLASQRTLYGPVADEISYITENGALFFHDGKATITSELDEKLTTRIFEETEKRPECKVLVSCVSTCYVKSGDDDFLRYMRDFVKNKTTAINSFYNIQEPILKIAFIDQVNVQSSYTYFKEIFDEQIKIVTSGNSWIDFIPYHSNKATALKTLIEKMGIKPSEVMSFGDQRNDIEMLDFTGISYAMSHAADDVKAHATNITDSVEQTLREFIKTLG